MAFSVRSSRIVVLTIRYTQGNRLAADAEAQVTSALAGLPYGAAYGTSKGAAVNFTRTLAGEWGEHGITVNALAPGFFPSKMTKGTLQAFGVERLSAAAPLRRIGDDDDLKGAALLFASAAGKHITGQILAVDGGVSAVHGGG